MLDAFEKDAITTAFKLVTENEHGYGYLEINGYPFNVGDPCDEEILAL